MVKKPKMKKPKSRLVRLPSEVVDAIEHYRKLYEKKTGVSLTFPEAARRYASRKDFKTPVFNVRLFKGK